MITVKIVRAMRRVLDDILTHVADETLPGTRIVGRISERVAPQYWAAVEMRRGNIASAARLAATDVKSRVYVRASQMLNLMNSGISYPQRTSKLPAFNGSVLFLLHSAPSFDANGYAIRSVQILKTLRNGGMHPVPVTRLGYPTDLIEHAHLQQPQTSKFEDIIFYHLPASSISITSGEQDYIREYAKDLVALARGKDFTVIHSHSNFLNGIAANIAARELGLKSVYEMRGLWHWTRAVKQPAYAGSDHYVYCDKMEIEAAKGADEVVAISNPMKNWLVKEGVDQRKITVVGNAADDSPSSAAIGQPRVEAKSHFTIGYIGSITAYEGLDCLLQAVQLLRGKHQNLRLIVAGNGEHTHHLHKLAKQLGLQNCVEFLGRVERDAVDDLYAQFDVCPLARSRHPVTELVPPLKPFEIMKHGVPLIVSRLGPLMDIVQEGKTGLVCEPDDPRSLADVIERLMQDRALAQSLVRNAETWVLHEANWSNQLTKYEKIYSA